MELIKVRFHLHLIQTRQLCFVLFQMQRCRYTNLYGINVGRYTAVDSQTCAKRSIVTDTSTSKSVCWDMPGCNLHSGYDWQQGKVFAHWVRQPWHAVFIIHYHIPHLMR